MKQRALLIGINDYHLLGGLKYARQDAEAMAGALCSHCGFSDEDITVMSCQAEGATMGFSRYIEHALMSLADFRDLDLLVFGFWGHGFSPTPGQRYLCGMDTAEHDLERTAVSFDVVKAKLAQAQASNTLLLLDCCQNRPAGRATSAEPMTTGEEATLAGLARDIQAAQRAEQKTTVPTVAILNACREGQKAYEWDSRKHGIFTAHLLDAFEQGFGSIAPMASWIVDRVARTASDIHHQTQSPYVTIEGKGDIRLIVGLPVSPAITTKPETPPSLEHSPAKPRTRKNTLKMQILAHIQKHPGQTDRQITDALRGENAPQQAINQACRSLEDEGKLHRAIRSDGLIANVAHSNTDPPEAPSKSAAGPGLAELRRKIALDMEEYERARDLDEGTEGFLGSAYANRLPDWKWASDLGWPEGLLLVGRCMSEGIGMDKDAFSATRQIHKAAEQGDAVAQHHLAFCYAAGEGVSKDQRKAVKWRRKAAEQGDAFAQTQLGWCYAHGEGVSKDLAEAVKWYRKAAEQGDAVAQHMLGLCYYTGKGVSEDHAQAAKWYRKAAEQGDAYAQETLKRLERKPSWFERLFIK